MSYGVNGPQGLQAIRTQTDASFNGAVSTYSIASGYANNIFKGDLVYINTDTGYIQNVGGYLAANYGTAIALGVFDGCSFTVPVSVNPTDPANPGRSYWPAGTVTLGGVPATCSIITDPNVVYNAQTTSANSVGATQADVGKNVSIQYQLNSDNTVNGNTITGNSLLSINIDTVALGDPQLNCYIDSLSTNPLNVAGQQYNNVEVMISNHYFRLMGIVIAPAASGI
jgi:hypothetical protein